MNPVVKILGSSSGETGAFFLDTPVVRVQARFGNTWAAAGTGFFIAQWPSSVITARHVVALPQGVAPAEVKIEAFVSGRWLRLASAAVAFPPTSRPAEDVAIVRIQGTCTSSLQAATMNGPCRVEIWGYPLGSAQSSGSPLVVSTRATLGPGQIRLDGAGRVGMSGAPVVAISESGEPTAVVGIYLGTAMNGAKAHPIVADCVFSSKQATMDAVLGGNPHDSR